MQDESTTNDTRETANGKARHAISRKSTNVLATTISVDNDCKQISMNYLSRSSKLGHLFGRSVVEYTTGHW